MPQLWMTIEPDMAIICACLPVMRPLVTMLLASPLYRSIASYLSSGSSAGRSGKNTASNTNGGSSAGPNSSARRGAGAGNNQAGEHRSSEYALSLFDSLEYLRDEDVEAGRLVPEGPVWPSPWDSSIGCQTQVSRSHSVGPDEVPLGAISVKTVVDCRKTVGSAGVGNQH